MYICICNAVTEDQIRKAMENGIHTMKELNTQLRVAAGCGKCAPYAKCILKGVCPIATRHQT